jgi:hypothetical protein
MDGDFSLGHYSRRANMNLSLGAGNQLVLDTLFETTG